jgi:hypothetical protein
MRIRYALRVVAALALVLVIGAGTATAAGGRPYHIELLGANEVPTPGDPDGSGTALITVNPGTRTVCWWIEVTGVEPIFAAHIHPGAAGVPGGILVPLSPTSGCTTVSRDIALDLIRDPESYYVNVHNAPYPAGALRGQLR